MPTNNKQTGLGRGFESLIPQNFDNTLLSSEQDRIQKLPISDILPNGGQPRTTFDETLIQELANSIAEHGVLQPIIVRSEGDKYTIVAGERRWRAAQKAGLSHMPAIVRSMKDLERLQIALVENVQRVDLSPLEQAVSIKQLVDQFNMSLNDIAKQLGKAPPTVTNIVRLLGLPVAAQEALRDKLITEGHARAILALKNYPDKQTELLQLIVKNGWTVRQAEQFAVATKDAPKEECDTATKRASTTTTPATDKLSKHIGRPVSIRRLAKGGKLEIAFKSDDELKELIALLNKIRNA